MTVETQKACAAGVKHDLPGDRKESSLKRILAGSEFQTACCALGIYTCYLYYGFLHEKIFKSSYDGRHFTFTIFLVFVQCILNSIGAAIVLPFAAVKKADTTPHYMYAIVAFAYASAMLSSFAALQHMSYPMQVLGKSCKMIPVMFMGVVVRKRKYSWKEYLCVALISLGVATFSYKPKASAGHTTPLGIALLLLSLAMDGFTGPYQEKITAEHSPSTHQLMFWQNVWASIWLLAAVILSRQGSPAVAFLREHPDCIKDILFFCITSAVGQNFIFYTVRNISALACTTITTTRKFFTLLASVVVFKHSLNLRQAAAVSMVFTGIIWEGVMKFQAKQAKKREQAAEAATEDVKKDN